ncbi:hypothetical protein ABH978_004957 [Bradyrhizobium ottawaense]
MRSGALTEADGLETAIPGIEPAEQALALRREPDRTVRGGREIVQADTGTDREVFCPERALLGKTWANHEQGGAGSKKLAAIHGVTPTAWD